MAAWILLGASIAWLVVLAGTASGAFDAITWAVFRFSSFICHQQPNRSFHWSAQWPVCARCLGLYAAAPAGAIGAMLIRSSRTGAANFLLLCIASLPTLATWGLEHIAGWSMTNGVRFWAALPLGAAITWVIARTLAAGNREYSTGMN